MTAENPTAPSITGSTPAPLTLVALVSGQGSTLRQLMAATAAHHLPLVWRAVLADRPCPALSWAQTKGLCTDCIPKSTTQEAQLQARLADFAPHGVLCLGYLGIIGASVCQTWQGRLVNVHPSLLPRHGGRGMYGSKVHQAVLEAGDPVTGATLHAVSPIIDAGTVLAQARCEVMPQDNAVTLAARVQTVEIDLLLCLLRRWAQAPLECAPFDTALTQGAQQT